MERVNQKGVKYRVVMSNFFTEIERCIRLGIAFDLLWDLPGIRLSGYREVVRIREDGKVAIEQDEKQILLDQARMPARPSGLPPRYEVMANFSLDQPGNYRLRAATVDLAGRTTVTWIPIVVAR